MSKTQEPAKTINGPYLRSQDTTWRESGDDARVADELRALAAASAHAPPVGSDVSVSRKRAAEPEESFSRTPPSRILPPSPIAPSHSARSSSAAPPAESAPAAAAAAGAAVGASARAAPPEAPPAEPPPVALDRRTCYRMIRDMVGDVDNAIETLTNKRQRLIALHNIAVDLGDDVPQRALGQLLALADDLMKK